MTRTGSRLLAAAVCAGGVGLVVWYCTRLPEAGLPIALVLVAALTWSTIAFALNAVVGAGTGPDTDTSTAPEDGEDDEDSDAHDVTTVVVATEDDPDEVVRTSIALAQAAGPVVLVDLAAAPRRSLASGLGVVLAEGDGTQGAIDAALEQVDTLCVAVVRARACVVAGEMLAAARRVTGDVGWVTGRTEAYNDDGFSPAYGRSIGDALREHARTSGLPMWAPDATVVRTEAAISAGGFRSDRPWGSMLRRMAAAGFRGSTHDGVITAVAAPAEAEPFWRIRVAEARAEVAEATDALVSPGITGSRAWVSRARAAGLVMRDLRGWVMLAWLLAFGAVAATGAAPVASQVWLWSGLVVVYAAARAVVTGLQSGMASDPGAELVSAVYEFPISLSATAGLARRSAPIRAVSQMASLVPSRLLAWAAILVSACTVVGALELAGVISVKAQAQQPWGIAGCVALVVAFCAGMWRAHGLRRSGRVSFRFPVVMPVSIGGRHGHTDDVSPGGLRVRGTLAPLSVGDTISIDVITPTGVVTMQADVRWTYPDGDETVAGLSLAMADSTLAEWTRTVFAAADVLRPRAEERVRAPV